MSAHQSRALRSKSKQRLLNCGRFGGKTFVMVLGGIGKAIRLFAEHQRAPYNSWRPLTRPGPIVTVGLFAPCEGNQKAMWQYLDDLVPRIPGKTDGMDNTTILRGDGLVYLFGLRGIEFSMISLWNDGGARSGGYDVGIVDEAGLLKRPSIFHQVVKPLVIRAGYYGDLTMGSTPYNNHWDRWCESARDQKGAFRRWEYHHWTCFENPYNTPDKIEEILASRDEDPYGWRREYLAELYVETPAEDTIAGTHVFDDELLGGCYAMEAVKATGPYTCGLDLAWGGTDNAVLAVIDKPTNMVVHLEVYPKTSDQDLLDILGAADTQWGNPDIWFDRTGSRARAFSDFIPSRFRAHPLVFRRSIDRNRHDSFIVSKDLLIRSMTQRMTLGKLRFPHPEEYPFTKLPWANQQDQQRNFKRLYAEMMALKRVTIRRSNGTEEYMYRAERGHDTEANRYIAHDDCVDAILLAARGLPAVTPSSTALDDLESHLMENW